MASAHIRHSASAARSGTPAPYARGWSLRMQPRSRSSALLGPTSANVSSLERMTTRRYEGTGLEHTELVGFGVLHHHPGHVSLADVDPPGT
jgi:hypothetical protein